VKIAVFFAIALFWLTGPASAQAKEPALDCTRAHAVTTTIEAVQADYRSWSGRCVSLQGIEADGLLFADRYATLERDGVFGEDARRHIVLYPLRDRLASPRWVEVTGMIGSCADHHAAVSAMQDEQPDLIIMVSGYCHTSLATYVHPIAIRRLSLAPIARLAEAEVQVDRRGLVEAPSDLPGVADHAAKARALAAVMATGDGAGYVRLTRPEVQDALDGERAEKPVPDWVRRELKAVQREFARSTWLRRNFAAMGPLSPARERIFVDRADLAAARKDGDAVSTFFTCWCRTKDCTGRWPVAAFDADNDPARPYLCAETGNYTIFRKGEVIQATVASRRAGFAEPDWPAEP
jgi:hypothetical protein